MNKGLEIRNRKRKKAREKMNVVKEVQKGVCRFVWIEYMLFHNVNGKTKPFKIVGNVGLQLENKVYLNDGTYKYINNKHLKIKKIYEDVPNDTPVNERLLNMYQKTKTE